MDSIKKIEKKRMEILKEVEGIRSMRRGRVNEQLLKVMHKGESHLVPAAGETNLLSPRSRDS